ncbi:MAG TPA: hypothetical protein VK815_16085 [Candidatus Acidoferrales bacterium]|nr:hypothetical protein [Candidatus Acidoferrales bacterium]
MIILFIINALTMSFFLVESGLKPYVTISSFMTFGALGFIVLVLKHGFMIGGKASVIKKADSPFKFYVNAAFLLGIYLFMLAMSVGLYFQETEHSK